MENQPLTLKVCGMRDAQNIRDLLALRPNYMGFIFFEKSSRHAEGLLDEALLRSFPPTVKKVGVFVNASKAYMLEQVHRYGLNVVQLHGQEPPALCAEMQAEGLEVFKVFSVGDTFDMGVLAPYTPHVDYFLFDTKGKQHGGNGVAFNWQVLRHYAEPKPFILSGGLSLENLDNLQLLNGLPLHGLDVNSKFETAPAMKDVGALRKLMERMGKQPASTVA